MESIILVAAILGVNVQWFLDSTIDLLLKRIRDKDLKKFLMRAASVTLCCLIMSKFETESLFLVKAGVKCTKEWVDIVVSGVFVAASAGGFNRVNKRFEIYEKIKNALKATSADPEKE